MHHGLPVLASNTGGPLETIVEGETGWLRDAQAVDEWTAVMRKVLFELSPEDLERMSMQSKERVQKEFSLTAMGDRLDDEISDMLSTERRPFSGVQHVLLAFVLSGVLVSVLAAATLKAL